MSLSKLPLARVIAPGITNSEKITLIEPMKGWGHLNLPELWAYRELLYFFIWRDIKVRYKQTLLGAAWAILQPFFSMVVFSIFFGRLANMPSDDIPYPIFSYAALLPWTFFATGLTNAARCLVRDANLVKHVYFPRMIVPISSVVGGIPDFLLAFLVLLVMMVYYSLFPTALSLLMLPVFLLLALITSLGVGFWLATLNAQYRDVTYVVPFMVQLWMFITPVVYPSSLLDQPWRTLYGLNPMVGVVEGFRWALLGKGSAPGLMLLVSAGMAVLILISGMLYFRRTEPIFADVL